MLMMGSKMLTIEGITVFPDHADEQQYWYLPGPVDLARRDGKPQFTLIRYRPAVADSGVQGGGFLTMEVELKLEPEVERKIMSALSAITEGRPRLSVVPFDEGTVQIIALNIQGSGGTTATPPPPGAFVAVESILGASKPALGGNNNAVFSLTLSQEGAIILDQAFRQGAMPVGIIYDLKYTALRPALDVQITANFKRIFDHLSMGIDLSAGAVIYGVPVFLEAGIDLAFEKLKQDGVIEVKVINFANAADEADKEKWALDFFKEHLLAEWFKPTLPPVTFDNDGGTTGGATPGTATPGGATPGTATPGGGEAPGGEVGLLQHSHRIVREVWAYPFSETGRQPAQLEKRVEPETPSYDIQLAQSATNDQVTLTFVGGQTAPTVRINNEQQSLSAQRQRVLNLAPGTTLNIEAVYSAAPSAEQEFRLLFDFDKPRQAGWSTEPPSGSYRGYLTNETDPFDTRFQSSNGQPGTPSGSQPGGANALRSWLQNALGSPRRVRVDSHASFEGYPFLAVHNQRLTDLAVHNQRLTERRREVALGIIGSDAEVTSSTAHGFSVAQTADRISNENDRRVSVRGASSGGQAVSIRGTLSRAAATPGGPTPGSPTPGSPTPGGPTPSSPTPSSPTPSSPTPSSPAPSSPTPSSPAPSSPTPGSIPGMPPMGVKLAFRLKKIEQIEDKSVTLRYNRQSAIQRSYAPQGLIGLLADDLDGPPHFIEVDLDSPFFRKLNIEIDAPVAFEQIGLAKADVAIEYGRPSEPAALKHKDVSFRPTGAKIEKASFFLNSQLDLNYSYIVQYHFNPLSGWDGEKLSYDLQKTSTLDRTLMINPFRDFGFLEVQVIPGDLDSSMIDSTDVHLHYEDPGKWSRDKVITVKPDSSAQVWKLRLSDPECRTFTYRFIHRLNDGSTRETEPESTRTTSVMVNDPFEDPLIVEFFPNYDATNVKILFVDVVFEDPVHLTRREEQLRFVGHTVASQRLRFVRSDLSIRAISFQITILDNDNSVRRLPHVISENSIIFLGEHMGLETDRKRETFTKKKLDPEAKTYAYKRSQKSKRGDDYASVATKKQQLINAFEQFIEALLGTFPPVASGVNARAGSPGYKTISK